MEYQRRWADTTGSEGREAQALTGHVMGDRCRALGFGMDCGHAFCDRFGEDAFHNPDALSALTFGTDDIDLLGSAIYSQWRYWNHWANWGPDPDDARWFAVVCGKLADLAMEAFRS